MEITRTKGPLLEARGVTLQYKTNDHRVMATDGFDFEVFESKRSLLLGLTGCGKSTLLKAVRAVSDYTTPTAGQIRLKGAVCKSRRPTA
jgi:NitT/TauT family transport system ATP-binding protein